jgi:hypothetical protein
MKQVASYVAGVVSALVVALLLSEGWPPMDWNAVTALAAVLGGLAAPAGLLFVGLQMRSARRLARAQFVNVLAHDIDDHYAAQSFLDPKQRLYDDGCVLNNDDMARIEKYLNFFERVEYIRDTGVLNMETIDGLFAYRFFYLVHNPNVQKQVLGAGSMPYYRAIFRLHDAWLPYRQSRKLRVPRPETPLRRPLSA